MAATTNEELIKPAPKMRTVVRKHFWLVRLTHWLNIPLLVGLFVTGISIYWAAPVYKHVADPTTGNEDYLQDIGMWICKHVPGQSHYDPPGDWLYNHISLGTGLLADALRLHWLFAYPFMLIGIFYIVGAIRGGGYRSLLPRRGDIGEVFAMIRYYTGLPFAKILRKPWHHPVIHSKYNALQRGAYFSVVIAGLLVSLTGWAIHKPSQLWWLDALFGSYSSARAWHFWLAWFFIAFAIPHVILVALDGWDTFRSMIVGWSERVGEEVKIHG